MPVTAGHVPGLTSGLRRVRTDPHRFHTGRWFLLAEGVLVSAFGVAGLISAALHPHAGPTGAPVLGLASTPAHSAMLLAFGVIGIAAVANRRAAVTVTALSAIAYMMLLFFSSVATARGVPTPLGFHAADIVLDGVLAVVNLALLMWLIPDELGDEAWVPRRRRERDRERRQPPASEAARPSTVTATDPRSAPAAVAPSQPAPANPPISARPARAADVERPGSQEPREPSDHEVGNSTEPKHPVVATNAVRSPRIVGAVAVLAAVVGIVIWMRRR